MTVLVCLSQNRQKRYSNCFFSSPIVDYQIGSVFSLLLSFCCQSNYIEWPKHQLIESTPLETFHRPIIKAVFLSTQELPGKKEMCTSVVCFSPKSWRSVVQWIKWLIGWNWISTKEVNFLFHLSSNLCAFAIALIVLI